jgi:hypothetical protein
MFLDSVGQKFGRRMALFCPIDSVASVEMI